MTNYLSLPIMDIHKLLKEKKITPLMLVEEAYDKIEKSNLNAFITLNKDEAIKEAKHLETMEVNNPLFGLPIAIKDNIVTKDLRTTCASKMLENFCPIYDATVVRKLKEKHMIIIGKTNMDEFAMGSTGETSYFKKTLNPCNNEKVPGGSSSGSAACVGGGLLPFALGSDTGGSIRQPASFCGIVGMKPTYGRVSRYGLIAFASSLDQIGPMTRNVFENALLLETIAGHDCNDSTSSLKEVELYSSYLNQDIQNMKIAIPNYYMSNSIDPSIRGAVLNVKELLIQNGAIVEMIDIPYLEYAIALYQTIALAEASSNLARFDGIRFGYSANTIQDIDSLYKKSRSEGFGEEVKRRIMIGSYVLSGENANMYFKKALKLRGVLAKNMKSVFDTYDLIIGPTNTNVAYDFSLQARDPLHCFYDDLLTVPVNMAGLPALSMPIGKNDENLPIGMQIIGNSFDEKTIYKLASFIEKELSQLKKIGDDKVC